MKILIHPTNGSIITIDKLLRSEDKIILTKYDNGILKAINVPFEKDGNFTINLNKTIIPTELLAWNDYINWICEQTSLLRFNTYQLAGNLSTNYVFLKGITNANTVIRVYIPFELAGQASASENSLYTWMETVKTQKAFRTNGRYGFVQYLETLSASDKTMLESYINVIDRASGVILDWRLFSINFTIQQNGIAYAGATVSINGKSAISDASGLAVIDEPQGTYNYTVTFLDSFQMAGSVTVNAANRNIPINRI